MLAHISYKAEEETCKIIEKGMYLCDSGGQYVDGTTDVTRTMWLGGGDAGAEERECFTRVLQGHVQ